jgi:hypothetical protein
MTTAQMMGWGKTEMMYAMPITVNTMSAIVIAGLNISNKRLLEIKMVVGIPSYSSIYIYSYSVLNKFRLASVEFYAW